MSQCIPALRSAGRILWPIALLALLVTGLVAGSWWVAQDRAAELEAVAARPSAGPQVEAARQTPPVLADASAPREPEELAREPAPLDVVEAEPDARSSEEDRDLRVRFDEVRRLARTNPSAGAPALRAFIDETVDAPDVQLQRLAAIALLGAIDEVPTAPDLIAIHASGDPATRRAAAIALERQGDPSLVKQELLEMQLAFGDPDGGVRMRAVEQVARMGSKSATTCLLPMLSDVNSEVRIQAIEGLRGAGDPSVIPQVEALLDDPVARVRERAERALAALHRAQDSGGGH